MKQNDDSTDGSGQRHRVATVTMDSYVDAAKIIRLPFNLVILRKALRSQRICPICCLIYKIFK